MEENYIKEQKVREITQEDKNEELINSLRKVKLELEVARNNFEYAEDELVDYFTYQIKANQAKMDYLLGKIKKRGIVIDLPSRLNLLKKNII